MNIRINAHEYPTSNWSMSGFRVDSIKGNFKPGDTLDAYVSIPFQGFNIAFPARISVVRYDPASLTLGAAFQSIDERSRQALEAFVQGIISGEMEPVDGIIRRLDIPVTPISLSQEKKQSAAQEERDRQRGIRIYIAAGMGLAVILAGIIYTNFFQLKIDTAVVMGTNDVFNAPTSGTVSYIADLNTNVVAGMALISLTDPRLDYDITLADLKVRHASIESRRLDSVMQIERERAASANGIVSKQWEAATHQVASLQKDLQVKEDLLRKTKELVSKGLETNVMLQKVQSDYMETERYLNEARLGQVTLEQQLAAVKGGFNVRDQNVQPGLRDIQALATAANEKLAIAKSERDFLIKQRDNLTIIAPTNGRIVRQFTPLHSPAKYGDPVAVFERDGKRVIQAFLTQQEALDIVKGQRARTYLPYSWWSIPVQVTDIDYYSLTLNQTQGRFQWVNLLNNTFKTVIVMLEPTDSENAELMQRISPGTAATVVF